MGNIFFAHPNFADVDFYTPVISGGSWEANLPVANLQTDVLSEVARSTDADAANTQLHADLAVVRDVRVVVIPQHNFSRSARARVTASTQIAFSGVRLAAAGTETDTSLSIEAPAGSAVVRTGDSFRLTGDDTVYTATSGTGFGTNVVTDSEDITGTNWSVLRGNRTINQEAAPNGTSTADLFTETTDSGTHFLSYSLLPFAIPASTTQIWTASLFIKPAGCQQFDFSVATGAGIVGALFDLADESINPYATGGTSNFDSSLSSLPNGWYRVSVSGILADFPYYEINGVSLQLKRDGFSYTGDGESGVYVWGLQVEEGNLTNYSPFGASGTINISPALAMNHDDETALTALCGEYVSTPPVVDSGWLEMFPVVYPYGTLPWGHPSAWDGRVSEEERQEYPSPLLYILDQAVSARYWKIEIDDESNGDGYVEIARLFLARGYQPTRNFGYGLKLGVGSDTTLQEAKGGARYFDREEPRRSISGTIAYVPDDEALARLYDMVRRLGTDRQVFVSLDPDASTHLRRISFLATIVGRQELEYTSFGRKGMAIQLEEVIG